jgi:hypothetical protein
MIFLFILFGLVGYTIVSASMYFVCKTNKIGVTEYSCISDDNTGALVASIFWPVGIFIVFGVLFFKVLDSNYEKLVKKRRFKER